MNAVISKLDRKTHRNKMMNILLDISRDQYLSRNLVFKGGTALYFFHNLDRFSTDLDFDILKNTDEDVVMQKIKAIAKKYWEIKDHRIKRHTLFSLISYGEIDHNIKIEIHRGVPTGESEFSSFMGIEILVMKLSDMTANKFLALLGRNKIANRDIYDIHFILQNNFEINTLLIETSSGWSYEEYIHRCIEFLKNLWSNYNVLDWLWEVIGAEKKQDLKDNLIKETIFLLYSQV